MRSGTGPHGDTCANKGDSGGGFVNYINNGTTAVLVGVMSFGMNDCGRPAVATNIFLYLPWINQLLDQGYQELRDDYNELKKEQSKVLKQLREEVKQNSKLVATNSKLIESLTTGQCGLENKIADNKKESDKTKIRTQKSSICGHREVWKNAGTITYETVQADVEEVGSNLNEGTGIFTAGANGVYMISLSGHAVVGPGETVRVELAGAEHSDEVTYFIQAYSDSGNGQRIQESSAATWHLALKVGQQLSLRFSGDGYGFFGIKFCVSLY